MILAYGERDYSVQRRGTGRDSDRDPKKGRGDSNIMGLRGGKYRMWLVCGLALQRGVGTTRRRHDAPVATRFRQISHQHVGALDIVPSYCHLSVSREPFPNSDGAACV
jgi:hypothetical protein